MSMRNMTKKIVSRMALVLGIVVLLTTFGVVQTSAQNTIPKKDYRLSVKRTSQASKNPDYTITTSQPVVETTDGSADGLNKAIDDYVTKAIADLKDAATQGNGAPPSDTGSSLNIRYDIYASDSGLISIKFIAEQYIQGAAHPGSAPYTLNYNLNTGKMIALADLFKPKSNYLKLIANFSVAALKAQNRLTFPEGAQPTAENYANWNLDHEGIIITFGEYQVGPYAEGPSDVYIPYTALGDALADTNLFFQ